LFAIAEELIAPGEAAAREGKPMLAVSQLYATEDLAITISRLLAPATTLIEDDRQHCSAQTGFQRWLMMSQAAGSGMVNDLHDSAEVRSKATDGEPEGCTPTESPAENRAADVHPPAPLPSGFWHGEPWRNALVH
jgi:hypothetical protein